MLRTHNQGADGPLVGLTEIMRRFVLGVSVVLLPVALGGCTGFGTFLAHSFSFPGVNPNRPAADSENVRRAYGRPATVDPLMPEKGNVWPGPQGPDPTLTDLEKQQNQGQQNQGQQPRPRGSSTPPGSFAPGSLPSAGVPPLPQAPGGPVAPRAPGAGAPGGTVVTPRGNRSDAGGTGAYRQLTTPGGAGAIVVPNGNGTSTVISPDGGVQVIPTPR